MIVSSQWETIIAAYVRNHLPLAELAAHIRRGMADGSIELQLPDPAAGREHCLIRAKARSNAVARVVGDAVAKSDVKEMDR